MRVLRVLLVACLFLASCGGTDEGPLVSADGVSGAAAQLDAVAAADVAATAARDGETWGSLFTDDIVIVDGDEATTGGVEEAVWIAEFIWAQYPDSGELHSATYVGLNDGIVVIDQWGFEGFTADAPFYEYRIYEVEDGVITAWEAVYDLDTRPFFGRGGMDEEAASLLERYLDAWNSGDAAAIKALYDSGAMRADLLFGEATGAAAIGTQIDSVLARLPGLHLELRETLGLRAHRRVGTGGPMSLTSDGDPCEVSALVYLESPGELITRERVYYQPASLIACGWAG